MIQAKARPLAKRPVYETLYPSIKEGKFSRKWVDDFISRHNLVDRRKITVAQWQQNDFLSCAFSYKERQYPLTLIWMKHRLHLIF